MSQQIESANTNTNARIRASPADKNLSNKAKIHDVKHTKQNYSMQVLNQKADALSSREDCFGSPGAPNS